MARIWRNPQGKTIWGTIRKRVSKAGPRYTARVRLGGIEKSKTFGTKGAAEGWVRAQEGAIETGTFRPTDPEAGKPFADAVDLLVEYRKRLKRPPGKTFQNALDRLEVNLGLTPLVTMNTSFWRKYALDRMADDEVMSQTAAGDLLYVGSVLRHAQRERWGVDAEAVTPRAPSSRRKVCASCRGNEKGA